jgi:hypothetical protein
VSRKASQLDGLRFGKLLVISRVASPNNDQHVYWQCQCDCGNITTSSSANLTRIKRPIKGCKSCGSAVRTHPWSQVLGFYKRNSKRTEKLFQISEDTFAHLISEPCDYCGQAPSQKLWQGTLDTERQAFRWNGLDRIDSSKGYTEDNVVPCCTSCNLMKSDKTREEFLLAIEAIHRWQHK